jgi:endo-1,4-beta-xylanase
VKHASTILLTLVLSILPALAHAQNESIIIEAESGTVGSQFAIGTDGATQYVAITSTVAGGNPGTADRLITYTVTFPGAGVYELYARLRVGPGTFGDDSFYYANGFGTKIPNSDADWILANGLANPVGFTTPSDKVVGGGPAQSQVWKWVKLSAFDGGEPPVAGFTVTDGNLVQTFQIAGREDGLWIDKLAFGRQGVFFTVFDLDNGLPGTTVPPPPPFTPTGPPIATGQPKFLGGVSSPPQRPNFTAYWNQVTPENGGKWGSVEGTRNVMSWGDLDLAYTLAKSNGFPFRMHNLIWGSQQPAWIESLPPAEQLQEIREWYGAVAARYPDIDFIDVVNEPLHAPPSGAGHGNYIEALGGTGASGFEWVLQSFRLAREFFPHAKLGINEYSITNDTSLMRRYIQLIQLLQAENLIDTVGVQGHAFSTRVPASTTTANLDLLATVGLPIYITELDIDGPTDEVQLADYQRIFPAFWEHPAVRGITLWGYRPGHWRTAQGAYIVLDNGAERPAMLWLKDYVAHAVLRPWITAQPQPAAQTVTVGDSASFTCAGDGSAPLAYAWRRNGVPISENASAATSTLLLTGITTADAGGYDCVVSNAAGSAVSATAMLTVNKAIAGIALDPASLVVVYDGGPHAVAATTAPAGLAVVFAYNGGPTPPVLPGTYAVTAVIDDANYVGQTSGTLTITITALVRHAPALNGALNGSVQMLLPENVTLNSSAATSGDLLVPGQPTVRLNGQPAYGGTLDGPGSASPNSHIVILNGHSQLRHVVRQVDPIAFPTVAAPPAGSATMVLNGNTVLVLGTAGATEPTVYNLQGLTLNGTSQLQVVGPVIVNVLNAVIVNGTAIAGASAHPEWLSLNVAAGGVTINGLATVNANVVAPAGTAMINGRLKGSVIADRLTINGNGVLTGIP